MSDSVSANQLRLFIERIERLEEEKKGITDDIKDVYAEAKSTGFDAKTMREIIKLRKMEKHHRDERDALLETYRAALGMDYSSTPLGASAIDRAVRKTVDAVNAGALGPSVTAEYRGPVAETDVVKLAADIHAAGGRMVGDTLVMPMSGLKEAAENREEVPEEELYGQAVALVKSHQKASTSWLQRQLRLGYNSAARLVERMEREGIVSAPNDVGARRVLIGQPDAIAAE